MGVTSIFLGQDAPQVRLFGLFFFERHTSSYLAAQRTSGSLLVGSTMLP
jgi:hypothetical protein